MNIAIKAGIADVKGFAEAMDDIDWESLSEEVVAGQEVAIMNQYIVGYGYFTDDDVKFAGVDFYVEEIEYEYPVWDYQGDIYYETYIYYEVMPRFVLSDGSKMRLEEYVNSDLRNCLKNRGNSGKLLRLISQILTSVKGGSSICSLFCKNHPSFRIDLAW